MKASNKVDVLKLISKAQLKIVRFEKQREREFKGLDPVSAYEASRRYWNEYGAKMSKTLKIKASLNGYDIAGQLFYPIGSSKGLILYIHGGGFVVGSSNTHNRIMRALAKNSGYAVLGADYTLAPQAKFPSQLEQLQSLLEYVFKHKDELSLSLDKLFYAGDSAGANMAIALYLKQRDSAKKQAGLVGGILLYYGLYGLKDSRSRSIYGGWWDYLRPSDIRYYLKQYLAKAKDKNSLYVNILNADLKSYVPPCFIAGAEFDPLLDDSIALFEILKPQGAKLKIYKGTLHAFLHYSRALPSAKQALKDGASFISSL